VTDLDDLQGIERLDSEDVLGAVERFPDQCREAWALGRAAKGLPDGTGVDGIVVLGMGGSGVSGDVVRAVVEPRLLVPFHVIKSYGPLPEWIGRNTLVFAMSYSGGTEETVAAFQEAHERGARSVAVSSGGQLAEMSTAYGVAHVKIPSGLQPRASLGYLTLPVLAVLVEVGLVPDAGDDVEEAIEVLARSAQRCHRRAPAGANPAKDLASRIAGRVPVIYGGAGLGAVAAYRFKCDLNEYGKTPAFWNTFPELDHNEIAGWNQMAGVTSNNVVLVLLRDSEEHSRIALRMDITRRLIEDKVAEVVELNSEGSSALARILSLILVTQLAAIYVGLAYEIDPGPVEVIQRLKKELADKE
jgi:glucose/mannose-6-phosphate isomerase